MSTAKARKVPKAARDTSTDEARATLALLQAPGYLDIKRAQAALALLQKIDPDYMDFQCPRMSAGDFESWARTIAEDAIRESLAAAEQKIAEAAQKPPAAPPAPVAPRSGAGATARPKGA